MNPTSRFLKSVIESAETISFPLPWAGARQSETDVRTERAEAVRD
ncbi:hypothetical protein AB1M95_09820 [Sulfitobacter sp. LCG007]